MHKSQITTSIDWALGLAWYNFLAPDQDGPLNHFCDQSAKIAAGPHFAPARYRQYGKGANEVIEFFGPI